jgi:hypothetical protein
LLFRTPANALAQRLGSLREDRGLVERYGQLVAWRLTLRARLLDMRHFEWRAVELDQAGCDDPQWMRIRELRAEHEFDGLLFPPAIVVLYDDAVKRTLQLSNPIPWHESRRRDGLWPAQASLG